MRKKELAQNEHYEQIKQSYKERITRKQAEVFENKKIINKLAQKEKQSFMNLKTTLHLESEYDKKSAYDVNG